MNVDDVAVVVAKLALAGGVNWFPLYQNGGQRLVARRHLTRRLANDDNLTARGHVLTEPRAQPSARVDADYEEPGEIGLQVLGRGDGGPLLRRLHRVHDGELVTRVTLWFRLFRYPYKRGGGVESLTVPCCSVSSNPLELKSCFMDAGG